MAVPFDEVFFSLPFFYAVFFFSEIFPSVVVLLETLPVPVTCNPPKKERFPQTDRPVEPLPNSPPLSEEKFFVGERPPFRACRFLFRTAMPSYLRQCVPSP